MLPFKQLIGLLYEIKDFISSILQGTFQKLSRKEIVRMTDVQDCYLKGEAVFRI